MKRLTGRTLAVEPLTIGFARRATAYKRADLIFSDISRLRAIRRMRPFQLVFAGKAHPRDEKGKELIRRVARFARDLGEEIPVVYLPDYRLELAKLLVAGPGVDDAADLYAKLPIVLDMFQTEPER